MEPTGKDKRGRRALGRGLDALLPPRPAPATPGYGSHAVFSCPIERIAPQRGQPRKSFDDAALDELAATIREHGIIQPLVVRRVGDDRFEIVAGERRWRAAQRAGKKDVPVVVKDVSPEAAYELALIENLQREDLNAIEIAEAYARLLEGAGSQEEVADRVGKSRVTVTNALRLLKLPDEVRDMVRAGALSEGHGRALLGAPDVAYMLSLARRAVRGKLSVRRTEELVRRAKDEPSHAQAPEPDAKNANLRDLEMRIGRRLGTRAQVEHKGPGGKLVVHYTDLDTLDRILDLLDA